MRIKSKAVIIFALAAMLAISTLLFLFLGKTQAKAYPAEQLFETNNNIQLTPGKDNSLLQQKGLEVKALTNGASVRLGTSVSGVFSIEFAYSPNEPGTADFTSLVFTFTDVKTGRYFTLSLNSIARTETEVETKTETENGTETTTETKITKAFTRFVVKADVGVRVLTAGSAQVSFDGEQEGTVKVIFDAGKMTLYQGAGQTRLIDFTDLARFITSFNSVTQFDTFEKYNVSAAFNGLTGNSAAITVFSVNEHSTAGENLDGNQGPVIFSHPKLAKGQAGKPFAVDTDFETYDLIDGYKKFLGEIFAQDPSGVRTKIEGGVFTPQSDGSYSIIYIPVDTAGIKGKEFSFSTEILDIASGNKISLAVPVTDSLIGKGTRLKFPKADFLSIFATETSGDIPVSLTIKKGTSTVMTREIMDADAEYLFAEAATYSAVYSATDFNGDVYERSFTVTAEDAPVLHYTPLKTFYTKGEVINLSGIYASGASGSVSVAKVLEFPDGRKGSYNIASLDAEGLYKLTLSYSYSSKSYRTECYFLVQKSNADLFDTIGNNTIIENNVYQPDYIEGSYNGIKVTAAVEGDGVTFNSPIDISDNTYKDTLIEFLITPDETNTVLFTQLAITLVDALNPDNYMIIRLKRADNSPQSMNFSVELSNGGYYESFYIEKTTERDITRYFGFTSSFYGKSGEQPAQSARLHYSHENKAFYGSVTRNAEYTLLAKLDDPATMGDYVWQGFESGDVYISVTAHSFVSSQAKFMIMELDGQRLGGEYAGDSAPPVIRVLAPEGDTPVGVAGKEYKFFPAYAFDTASGSLPLKKTVYFIEQFGGEKIRLKHLDLTDGGFTPDKAGEYVIVYSAKDDRGLISEAEYKITVLDAADIPQLSYAFNLPSEVVAGEDVEVVTNAATGGSGNKSVDIKVFFGSEEILLENGFFVPLKTGSYTVKAYVSDYIESREFTHNLQVSYAGAPTIYQPSLPVAVLAGQKLSLPKPVAANYSADQPIYLDVECYVNGVKLSGFDYTPAESESVLSVVYKAAHGGKTAQTQPFEIQVVSLKAPYLTSYFYTDGIEIVGNDNSFSLNALSGNGSFEFIRPLPVYNFSFLFSTPAANVSLSGIKFTLTDALDSSLSVVFTIRKHTNPKSLTSYMYIGGKQGYIGGSLYGYNDAPAFEINFNSLTGEVTDFNLKTVGFVTAYQNGKAFKGFSGGTAYLTVEFENASAGDSLTLSKICEQSFSRYADKDRIGPVISVLGEISRPKIGEDLIIPAAIAFDVLSDVKSVEVEVTFKLIGSKDINAVYKGDAGAVRSVKANQYGVYSIKYTATDGNGATSSKSYDITVYDLTPPVITFSKGFPTSGSVNKFVNLPQVSLSDDNAAAEITLSVYAVKPDGSLVQITSNGFTPDQKGRYTVVYFATDSYGNAAYEMVSIQIK